MAKVTSWLGRHKKLLIILAALLIVGGLLYWFVGRPILAAQAMVAAQTQTVSYIRTTTLEKTTLSDTVSATGVVESADVSNVTTTLNYTVKSIPVQVGDTVQAGDVICTLDTSELDKKITRERENIVDAQEKAQDTYDDAKEALHDARDALDEFNSTGAKAYTAYKAADAAYSTALASISPYQNAVNAAQKEVDASGLALNAANAAGTLDSSSLAAVQDRYTAAEAALVAAKKDLETAKTNANYNSLYQTYSTAKTAYESAEANLDTYESREENAIKALATASENLDKAAESDTLDDLLESLEDCTLRAESAGKITALNATVGNVCTGTVATIQDMEDLKISISIAEYDIKSVAVGMEVIITSDAVDGEIKGTLSQISPTATVEQSGSSTFAAEVSVEGGSNGLLIGVNAKVQIVLSTTDDIFVVPQDAIEADDDGKTYVYVKTGGDGMEAAFERVEVETGASTDYYIEIMGSTLAEGMEVRSSANLDEATATQDASMNFMFGDGMGSGAVRSSDERRSGGNMGGAPGGM